MSSSLKAGIAYFAIVFAAGFILGTVRVLLLVPHLGETTAVLIESPVILGISWFVCRWLIRVFAVPATLPSRIVMGAAAFACLMLAEAGLSILAFGRSPAEHMEHYRTVPGLIGLAGQVLFAGFPLIQMQFGNKPNDLPQ